jgi:hypothetical protein
VTNFKYGVVPNEFYFNVCEELCHSILGSQGIVIVCCNFQLLYEEVKVVYLLLRSQCKDA